MKIKPNKHFDIKKSVLYRTTFIIDILKNSELIKFQELYYKLQIKDSSIDFKSYILSLNLLFCLGKIEYYGENDTIGLICNETK